MKNHAFENMVLRYIVGEKRESYAVIAGVRERCKYLVALSCLDILNGSERLKMRLKLWRAHFFPLVTAGDRGLALIAALLLGMIIAHLSAIIF